MDPLTRVARDAARGDSEATAEFVRATRQDVLRFVTYLAGPSHAEDLAQETYIRALRTLGSYRGDATVRSWLLAVARHVTLDWLRSDMRRKETPVDVLPGRAGVTDFTGNVELEMLVAGLEPSRRDAFVLTQIVGVDYRQAALILDCPVGTVRSRVFRARDDLAAMLADPGRKQRRTAT
ncbi:MAG: polymerase sigma-70 factor, subfamily [Frankiaceae bacterium]|nr:polymerase sigma-70 factor, subfamily [Frankiaceae bacterium]